MSTLTQPTIISVQVQLVDGLLVVEVKSGEQPLCTIKGTADKTLFCRLALQTTVQHTEAVELLRDRFTRVVLN